MGRIAETIRCMVRLTDSAILEVAIRWSSAFSRLTDALNAETQRQTIEQPKRASGRSFASVVTRKRPSLNRALRGMVQTQVTAQGWLGSTPEGRRPQIRGWRAGGSLAVASSTPATPLLSPAKIRELNHA